MWVEDTYIKIVNDKTAYLAIRKAVQSKQGRQVTKDAITKHCDRLLKGKRSNSYDEYLELVDKLINRFRRSNWAEKAFDSIMLCDIAVCSIKRYRINSPSFRLIGILQSHLSRLGVIDCPDVPDINHLEQLVANEFNYIEGDPRQSEQKQSVVDELYNKFMNEDKGAKTLVEVFYECKTLQDFTDQVGRRVLKKYKNSINYVDLNELVEKLRKYCISQPEPTRNKSELVHDAMDLIMNDTPTRNSLLRLCRKYHKRTLSSKYLFNGVRQALSIFNFKARDTVVHCVVRRLLAHSKRSGRGERVPTNRVQSTVNFMAQADNASKMMFERIKYTNELKERLRNREHTIGIDFAEVEQRCVAHTMKVSKEELGRMFGQAKPNLNKKETKMQGKIKVVTYVDGTDVNDLSNDQIFDKIQNLENQIANLDDIKVKSLAKDKQVKELNKAIKGLVKLVDAR